MDGTLHPFIALSSPGSGWLRNCRDGTPFYPFRSKDAQHTHVNGFPNSSIWCDDPKHRDSSEIWKVPSWLQAVARVPHNHQRLGSLRQRSPTTTWRRVGRQDMWTYGTLTLISYLYSRSRRRECSLIPLMPVVKDVYRRNHHQGRGTFIAKTNWKSKAYFTYTSRRVGLKSLLFKGRNVLRTVNSTRHRDIPRIKKQLGKASKENGIHIDSITCPLRWNHWPDRSSDRFLP